MTSAKKLYDELEAAYPEPTFATLKSMKREDLEAEYRMAMLNWRNAQIERDVLARLMADQSAAAIPAEVWAWYEAEEVAMAAPITGRWILPPELTRKRFAAIAALRKIKDAEPSPQPDRDLKPYRGE